MSLWKSCGSHGRDPYAIAGARRRAFPLNTQQLRAMMLRELRTLARELEAYPDEDSVWRCPDGITNSAGTLALHITGNLQHAVGALLGATGYVRDREREFAARAIPRADLLAEVERAREAVDAALRSLDARTLERDYPALVARARVNTADFLGHLLAHLAYHVGQVDYHRRVVTGSATGVNAVSLTELHSARAVTEAS